MKKIAFIAAVAVLLLSCFGCSQQPVQPREIDVVGKTLESACDKLMAEGWAIQVIDDTPNSGYVPGDFENGVTKYNGCKVTHVEFEPSKSAGRGYVTKPVCKVYFESGDQAFLEDTYTFDVLAFYEMYYDLWERFVEEGRSEELLDFAGRVRDDVVSDESDRVPLSYREVQSSLIEAYDYLLETLNGDASPYEFDIETIRQEHEQIKEKMSEHASAMSYKYGTGEASGAEQPSKPDGAIDWTEAAQHVGETVTVCGPVVGYEYASGSNGQPTFFDIGVAYPDESRVTAVIWGEDRWAFDPSPEALYEGQYVCVTGEVYLYNGVCNIKVVSPEQVAVV